MIKVDPLLVIIDANGNPLIASDDVGSSADSLISNFQIPTDGQYTVVVSYSIRGSEGNINVTLDLGK